jgi:hypothetical protein
LRSETKPFYHWNKEIWQLLKRKGRKIFEMD